jgi:hypothetical protein
VILARRVFAQGDATKDIGSGDACVNTQRHVGVADLGLVIRELASDLGGLPELFGLT